MIKSIYLIGVGGQGTVLATKILNKGLMQAGYDVKMSEIHGSAQRGGSVTTPVTLALSHVLFRLCDFFLVRSVFPPTWIRFLGKVNLSTQT